MSCSVVLWNLSSIWAHGLELKSEKFWRRGGESRTEMCGPGSVRTEALIRPEQLPLLQRSHRRGQRNHAHALTSSRAITRACVKLHMLWGKDNTLSCLITDGDIVINLLICKWKPSRRHRWRASTKLQSSNWKGQIHHNMPNKLPFLNGPAPGSQHQASCGGFFILLVLIYQRTTVTTTQLNMDLSRFDTKLTLDSRVNYQEYLVTFGTLFQLMDKLIWLQWYCDWKHLTKGMFSKFQRGLKIKDELDRFGIQ